MEPQVINQEILLFTGSSFCSRKFCKRNNDEQCNGGHSPMEELEKARNFIAHNRMLLPSEFQRLYMYISDWNRVIGL